MRLTLLDMTQRILESMGSDEVNSYSDTIESLAVANIIRETYYHLAPRLDLPTNHGFFNLTASGDNTKPVLMTVPSNTLDIDYIQYRHTELSDNKYRTLDYVPLAEFMQRSQSLNTSDSNVSSMTLAMNSSNIEFKYYTDRKPTFYTIIDDYNIVFDAYDSTVESTLTSANSLCYGKLYTTFNMDDNFIPDLDPEQFDLLYNEAKSQANVDLKQMQNPVSERRARKSWMHTQRTKYLLTGKNKQSRPDYGRKRP